MEKLCRICRTPESVDDLAEFYDDLKIPVEFYFVTGIKVCLFHKYANLNFTYYNNFR